MRIKEILQTIETLAPLSLQEEYDNSGIQVGDPNREATGALFCIDVTEDVIDEAISLKCNLIISHHPIAFKSFKSLTGKTYVERCMIKAIKKAGKSIVKSSEVFDVYTGEHVEAGYKSVAIQITFQDATKTLKDEDISKSMESILSTLEKSFDAKLRG